MDKSRVTPVRERRAGKVLLGLVVAVVIVGGGGWATTSVLKDRLGGPRVDVRDLYVAQITSFDIVIPASGELEALNQIEIRSAVEGQVTIKWIIDEGAQVKAGDLLVALNSDDIKNRVEEEDIRVAAAQADFIAAKESLELQADQNLSDAQRAKLKVELAELELKRWREGDVQTRNLELSAALEKAQRNQKRYVREAAQAVLLEKDGHISKSQLEDRKNLNADADLELSKARLNIEVYEKYAKPQEQKTRTGDLDEAQAEMARIRKRNASQLAQKEADLYNRQKQLEIRQSRLAKMQAQVQACTMLAPSDGLVVYATSVGHSGWRGREPPLQIGQQVYSNQLLLLLPDTSRMVAAVKVHETQFSLIKEGMKANVPVDAKSGLSLSGSVRSVGVMAEQSFGSQVREYTVKVIIDGENEWDLKPSMRCKADIFLERVENVLSVPVQAVFVEKGRHFVWVPSGRQFTKRYVEVGRASETSIEIIRDLEPGEEVLLREPAPGEAI